MFAIDDLNPVWLGKVAVCAFFAVLFLQSSLDKILDRKGNLEWLTGHFSKTPFAKTVPLLLFGITIVEAAAGIVAAGAVASLFADQLSTVIPTLAVALSALALLMLFTGQRIAKDYVGAAVLAAYFAVAVLGFLLTAIRS